MYNERMYPAVFLDRDGVIIENNDSYVRSWTDVVFIPGSLEALARFNASTYRIIIITNQSAVGRGLITLDCALAINRRVVDMISRQGGRIDGSYICPHSPQDDCECRKPRPGLLFQAAAALSLDLGRSILVGDALTDVMAGQNAGVRQTYLVRTGRGAAQANLSIAHTLQPFQICNSLSDVLKDL
jgi:D-glycero-D-manno-heptose 1,7-bisphosphate phosphatase